jgi:hypothetical protein
MRIFTVYTIPIFTSSNIYEVLHEYVSDKNKLIGSLNIKLEVCEVTLGKKYPMLIDILLLNNNLNVVSEYRKITYNLQDQHSLHELCIFYKNYTTHIDYLYEMCLYNTVCSLKHHNKKDNNIVQLDNTINKNENDIIKIVNDINNIATNVKENKSLLGKVMFPEEELLMLQKEIEQTEQSKKNILNTVNELEKDIEIDDNNLSKFASIVDDKEREEKRELDKELQEYNVFISGKEFTYPKIYNHFFDRHIIKTWDDLPALFIAKFPVYLYMDGKNTQGETCRSRLLDTDDEYRIYKMLYESITNDEYEMPDTESDFELVTNFINTLPPIQIMTPQDVLRAMNDSDDELFEKDYTSQCSGSSSEEEDM